MDKANTTPDAPAPVAPAGLTREDVFARKLSISYVRAFGKNCRVHELTPQEQDELDAALMRYGKEHDEAAMQGRVTAFWIAWCLRDTDGNRLFDEKDVDKIATQAGSRDTRRVWKALAALNGLSDVDEDGAGN
jgi:hypothetical protein